MKTYKTKGFQPDEIYEKVNNYIGTQVYGEGKESHVHSAAAEMALLLMSQGYVDKFEPIIRKTMSSYEKMVNRMKKVIYLYQKKCSTQKSELIKANTFINKLRDEGRITKDEIEIYFKK